MEHETPETLKRSATGRRPFPPEGHVELREKSLEERLANKVAELDRISGRVDLDVPPAPSGAFPRGGRVPLPPDPAAAGGPVTVVRGGWVAKYDPTRAEREKHLPAADRAVENSDAWHDFAWSAPAVALNEPWIHSWLMHGAVKGLNTAQPGDLVFVMRPGHLDNDVPWLARRTIIGVWWIESIASWTEDLGGGRSADFSDAACFPIRRFNFPVPIVQTGHMDPAFDRIAALRDRSRRAMIELSPDEALSMARACGLPAAVLSEPDENRLAPLCAGLDLGPASAVRQRILLGAKAVAHRDAVQAAARDVVVAALRRVKFGVVSTEDKRGIGSDLWARCYESNRSITHIRIEVKGLSGADPWAASLTERAS